MSVDPAFNRLKWRCRRGMRELDVLLTRYLNERWTAAGDAERAAFEAFLDLTDPEIFDRCLRRSATPSAAFDRLVDVLTGQSELSNTPAVNMAKDDCPASPEPAI